MKSFDCAADLILTGVEEAFGLKRVRGNGETHRAIKAILAMYTIPKDEVKLEWRTVIGKGAPAYEPGFPGWPTHCQSKEDALEEQRRCLAEAKTRSLVEFRVAPGEWTELKDGNA